MMPEWIRVTGIGEGGRIYPRTVQTKWIVYFGDGIINVSGENMRVRETGYEIAMLLEIVRR